MPPPTEPTVNIRLNVRILPILCVLVAVFFFLNSYRGMAILLIGLGGLWLISYYWARELSRNLVLRREMRYDWAQVGDRLEERFTLTNTSPLSAMWVEIVDHSTMPGYQASQVRSLNGMGRVRWFVQGICTQRGLYTLGPTTLSTGDPFGIYTVEISEPGSVTLMVTPPVIPLPSIQVAPGGRAGEGPPRVDAPERTVNAVAVREYVPGDSLRWVHWPTSARRGDLFVRVFEGAPVGDWWIVLDLDHKVQVGEQENSTLEHGIVLAASLADQGMQAGRSVGMIASTQTDSGEEELLWLPPQMSDEHRWEILRSLALVNPTERSLAELLELARPGLRQRTSLIVITPALDAVWIEALLSLRRQGVVPTVLLFDTRTFGGVGEPEQVSVALSMMGFTNEIVSSELFDRREARPGRAGHWEWRVTPLGRAVPVDQPEDMAWRDLK
jgi:uncharacterized protein (DUF58 family)